MIHQEKAQLERDYYNQNTKLAKEQRQLVGQNYLLSKGKVEYSGLDATAAYDFDWAQNLLLPHFSQQPKKEHYKSSYKVNLFGFQDGATKKQTNYLIEEEEMLDKGVNGTLSLVFDGIKRLNKGEKHLKLTCDNCSGQNKNNTTIQFLAYLVMFGYYQTIELHSMIAGHTKFSCDSCFGMIKKRYRKSTVKSMDDLVEVVEKSSPAGLNKVRLYENSQGFQYLKFEVLEKYFKKLPKIAKYHHFHFESSNLGIVKVQEFANSPLMEFSLWKDEKNIAEKIREIRSLVFPILKPKSLSKKRQKYLRKKVYPWIKDKRDKFKDTVYQEPRQVIDNLISHNYCLGQ